MINIIYGKKELCKKNKKNEALRMDAGSFAGLVFLLKIRLLTGFFQSAARGIFQW